MSAADAIKLQVRLPRDLHEQLQILAEEEQRSLNGQIVYLLRQAAAQAQAEQAVKIAA